MKRLILIIMAFVLTMLCSCSTFWQNDKEFYAGDVLTPEELQSYKDAFNTTKNPQTNIPQTTQKPDTTVPSSQTGDVPSDSATVVPETTVIPDSPSTSAPHTTSVPDESTTAAPDTSEIPDGTTSAVPETSETTALVTETDDLPDETTKPDSVTVYWTASGTKYHTHRDCGSLKNSTNVISGTLEEALEAEKEGLCKRCEKKDNPAETEE